MRRLAKQFINLALITASSACYSGAQKHEPLSTSVQATLHRAIADEAAPVVAFTDRQEARHWLNTMSGRLTKKIPDRVSRDEFLLTVHYEAKRAGLDPQLVLGLIQIESAFRKYAVSSAGARGFMQVMPFWTKAIGTTDHNLFHLRTNLRYGCVILRHYIDIENGNLFRALGRYNGSLGKPEYPNIVLQAWRGQWQYTPPTTISQSP